MAINEPQPAKPAAASRVDPAENMRRPVVPAIRWGAVLAGVAVGISVQLVLTLLGIASGLSSAEVSEGEPMGTGPLVWAGFSMLVAAFFGGYVAARMSGLKRKADGVLHGAVSWAVTTILFAALATSIGGSLVSGVFNNMSQLARTSAARGESPQEAMTRSLGARLDPQAMREFQQYIRAGQRDQAVQLIISSIGVEPKRAEAIVDQALILSGAAAAASPRSRATAESALQSAGSAAWVVFGAVALALAIGIGGGALGAAGARRVSWSTGPGTRP